MLAGNVIVGMPVNIEKYESRLAIADDQIEGFVGRDFCHSQLIQGSLQRCGKSGGILGRERHRAHLGTTQGIVKNEKCEEGGLRRHREVQRFQFRRFGCRGVAVQPLKIDIH